MCGICGFTGQIETREQVIHSMAERITHRGPDSDGFYLGDGVTMGFRRLSIIDLDAGHQPIYNEDKTLVITFNGEIYNYRQLREELIAAGHTFATESDTEVLVHGYEQWGAAMLPKLRGMFGFAICDIRTGDLFIARDFFGIKPIYYCRTAEGDILYASEIKCLLEHPHFVKEFNEQALDHYLSYQYSLPDETFFKGVKCLPPAHYMTVMNGEITITRYWEATFSPDDSMTEQQAVDAIDEVFTDSVAAHRVSDVPVGCFLSSGVDSAFVASYFGGQKAFTVGFDNGEHYNESIFASHTAEAIGVEHFTHLITEEEYWDALPKVQYHLDQPLADPACVALWFVCKLAAEQVKVVLSGEGADELFGGYRIYHEPYSLAGYQKLPLWLRKTLAAAVKAVPVNFKGKSFIIRGAKSLPERFIGNAFMFDRKQKARLLKNVVATDPTKVNGELYEKNAKHDPVTQMQLVDIHRWLIGDILLKAARMSMAHSLEQRVPFLDKEVFAVASRIPVKHRIAGGTTKYALRKAAARHLPEEATAKPKLGFPVPVRIWLKKQEYYDRVKAAFTSDTAKMFFRTEELVQYLDDHRDGKADNSRKVWTVYMFLTWYDVYFGEGDGKAV